MSKRFYLISKYMGIRGNYHVFHFIGFYKGRKVRRVFLQGGQFKKNTEYILALRFLAIHEKVLYAELIKQKELFN